MTPTDRTLAAMWDSYRHAVIPTWESPAQIRNQMFAFYGGASYVLDLLMVISEPDVPEDTGIATLARLRRELELFAAQQGARVKPGN